MAKVVISSVTPTIGTPRNGNSARDTAWLPIRPLSASTMPGTKNTSHQRRHRHPHNSSAKVSTSALSSGADEIRMTFSRESGVSPIGVCRKACRKPIAIAAASTP